MQIFNIFLHMNETYIHPNHYINVNYIHLIFIINVIVFNIITQYYSTRVRIHLSFTSHNLLFIHFGAKIGY